MLRNVRKLHSLIGVGILAAIGAAPMACSDDQFSGCAANRTCPASGKGGETGGGGEAGGETETGGSSGSGSSGRSGEGGDAGGDDGRGGSSTGGVAGASSGASGEGGEPTGGTGGSATDSGGEGGAPDLPDTTPPRVVSVSPTDEASGVLADANLVVTFSEPMDRVTTQAAYQSASILPAAVTFSWNATSTVLTINPVSDLEYADVADPGAPARIFDASITTTAEDENGNRIARDFQWSFGTMRRVTHLLGVPFSNVRHVLSSMGTPSTCMQNTWVFAGDQIDNSALYILVSADIRSLPEGIVTWESATLSGAHQEPLGDPYNLGVLRAQHLSVNPPASATWATPVLRELGVFSTSASVGTRTINVLSSLVEDYAQRATRNQLSQYRLRFDNMTNSDGGTDIAPFSCNAFFLTARYVLP